MIATAPGVADAAQRVGVDVADPLLLPLLEAALETQRSVCVQEPWNWPMHEAALRRFAFLWSSKPHSLGVLDVTDYGTQYLPLYHPDWDLLEMPRRKWPVA